MTAPRQLPPFSRGPARHDPNSFDYDRDARAMRALWINAGWPDVIYEWVAVRPGLEADPSFPSGYTLRSNIRDGIPGGPAYDVGRRREALSAGEAGRADGGGVGSRRRRAA